MITNRIRTIARNATGTALMASALGLSAVGLAGIADAAPVQAPQTVQAPQAVHAPDWHRVCWYPGQPQLGWWFC